MVQSLHLITRTTTAYLLVLLLVVTTFTAPARASELQIEEFTLGNGMRFVLIPNEQATAVMWTLWYKAGAADEVAGKTGLAHFLEHLMFKGTKTRASGQYRLLVEANGAQVNAFTTREHTVFHVRMQKDTVPLVMELEADRMRNLVFDDQLIETERGVIMEERRERLENDPAMLFLEERDALLFPDHPNGRPVIGFMAEMEKLSAQDARDFYNRFYHPNNAMAVVSGNISLVQLRELAEKFFGQVPASQGLPDHKTQALPVQAVQQRLERASAAVRWPLLVRQYAVPSFSTAEGKDAVAIDFVADLLGGGTQGLLVKELVLDKHLASAVGVSYDGGGRHGGTFTVTVSMNMAAGGPPDVAAIEASINQVLGNMKDKGPSAEQLAKSLHRAQVSRVFSLDRQSAMVMWVGGALMSGWNIQDFYTLKPWAAVTPDDVRQSIARNLIAERSVTGVLLRNSGATP
jgi:zinc protease